jgi:F-type H+-transporting ATPase subunit delta
LKNKLLAKLKDILKKDIILNEEIDKEILGGIIIKIGDTVIDGSLVKDLKNITNNMLNSKVRSELAYED